MALSKYISRRLEECPDKYVVFEEFKLDDYEGPTLECRDAILAVVWKFASREIISRTEAWICLTPIIPFLGYAGDFRFQRHHALKRAKEDGICVCTMAKMDAVGLDVLSDMPILNPLADDLSNDYRGDPKADFVRLSDLQPLLMNARTRNASILNRILAHELNWAEAHRTYTALFYARNAAEKDQTIASKTEEARKAEERADKYKEENTAGYLDSDQRGATRRESRAAEPWAIRRPTGEQKPPLQSPGFQSFGPAADPGRPDRAEGDAGQAEPQPENGGRVAE